MREIKFRALVEYEDRDKFIYPQRITFTPSVVYVYDSELDYEHQIEPKYLQQFTGMIDMNGKEIYDGDILSFHFTDFSPDGWKDRDPAHGPFPQRQANGTVFWDERQGAWRVKGAHPGHLCDLLSGSMHYEKQPIGGTYHRTAEVIGNLYQNPDLITP